MTPNPIARGPVAFDAGKQEIIRTAGAKLDRPARSEATMRAVVWHGRKDLRVEDQPKPTIGSAGDALVRVTTAAICGSDLHMYNHAFPTVRERDILGHEMVGVVEEVGPGVRNVNVGDRVVVSCIIACGACWYCKHDLWSCCDTTNPNPAVAEMYGQSLAGAFGYSHLTGGYQGGQAQYVRVPYADTNCLPIPDELPDDKAVFLADALCTGWMAADFAEAGPGRTVAVWGAGPVGLLALDSARVMGADRLIVVDNIPERLALAERRLGAETINFDEENVFQTILSMTGERGPDSAIEAAGFRYGKRLPHTLERKVGMETDSIDALSEVLRTVRKGGNVAIVGDFIGYANHFPVGALMEKALTVRTGQVMVHAYWRDLAERMLRGEIDPTFIVTHRLPLDEAAEAYAMFDKKGDGAIKILLKP